MRGARLAAAAGCAALVAAAFLLDAPMTAALLPTVLVILGVANQAFDLRGLRRSTDE